jgi:DNA-binding NarL/FixJ family response regulator
MGSSTVPLLRELRGRLPAGKFVVLAAETPTEEDLAAMAELRVTACVLLRDLTPRSFEHFLALVLDTPLRMVSDAIANAFVAACIPGRRPISPVARLSRRQSEVLALLAAGLSEKAIANRLGIGPTTVGKHVERLKEKVGVETRDQLVAYALDHSLPADREPGSLPR